MPETYQSVVVDAPISAVWGKIKDFHDLSWAEGVISSCEKVGDIPGNKPGAKRILNGAFHETLIEKDANHYMISYSIDDGPSPVAPGDVKDYIGTLHLRPVTDTDATFVVWRSHWESDSADAIEFCHGIYVAVLAALKQQFQK